MLANIVNELFEQSVNKCVVRVSNSMIIIKCMKDTLPHKIILDPIIEADGAMGPREGSS